MSGKIQCPSCGKEYRWTPQIAGKRAKCKCGEVIQIPAEDPSAELGIVEESADVYDIAPAAAEPPKPATSIAQGAAPPPLPTGAVSTRPVISYATPRRARCQACGADAPTKFVEFHQNVGALVVRFPRRVSGNLCKACINQYFWKMTSTTLAVGWLGTISIVVAPIFIVNNIVRYVGCRKLPASHDKS